MIDHRRDARKMVDEVDEEDYEAYADMVMRSLRGSWRRPQRRILILELLMETDVFDEDVRAKILKRCKSFRDNYFTGWHDGRTFRYVYQDLIDVDYDEDKARELAQYIPDDMTWNEYTLRHHDERTA